MAIFCVLSGLAACWLCEAMRHAPRNEHFRGRVELTSCVEHFFEKNKFWDAATSICLIGALQTLNIASIVVSAQGVDQAIMEHWHRNCGFQFFKEGLPIDYVCVQKHGVANSQFDGAVVSEGYLFCLILAVPLGILNLEDNIWVQVVTTVLCLISVALWMGDLFNSKWVHASTVRAAYNADSSAPSVADSSTGLTTTLAAESMGQSVENPLYPALSYAQNLIFGFGGGLLTKGLVYYGATKVVDSSNKKDDDDKKDHHHHKHHPGNDASAIENEQNLIFGFGGGLLTKGLVYYGATKVVDSSNKNSENGKDNKDEKHHHNHHHPDNKDSKDQQPPAISLIENNANQRILAEETEQEAEQEKTNRLGGEKIPELKHTHEGPHFHSGMGEKLSFYFQNRMWGEYDFRQVLGSVLSNFAFVMTVPSWVNEKHPSVSINKSVWYSSLIVFISYCGLGILAAAAFGSRITPESDFLSVMAEHTESPTLKGTLYSFPLMAALTGVPVCSIICRYNLLERGWVSSIFVANIWAVVLPWAISIPLQTAGKGAALQYILNYGSLFFGAFVNFVLPFFLYLAYRSMVTRGRFGKPSLSGGLLGDNDSSSDSRYLPEGQKPYWAIPEGWFAEDTKMIFAKVACGITILGVAGTIVSMAMGADAS